MKKLLSWVITITLLLSLTPALPVSADGAYAVLGVQDGDRIILSPQVDGYTDFQHKVTIVDSNQVSTKMSVDGTLSNAVNFTLEPTATGIDSVVFAIDGETVLTDAEAPYELVLDATYKGVHRLTATINKTAGGTEVKTVNFEGIIGAPHDSRKVNYNSSTLDAMSSPVFNGMVSRGETIEDGALKMGNVTGNGINSVWLQPDVATNSLTLGDTKLFYIDFKIKKSSSDVNLELRTTRAARTTYVSSSSTIGSGLPSDQWVHITVVADYQRGWFSAYMNGVQFKSWKQNSMLSSTSDLVADNFVLWNVPANRDLYIDDYVVRTYDKVLPADFTASSVEDGEEKVSERIEAIRVTGNREPKSVGENGVIIQAGSSTLTKDVDYEISYEGNDLVIKPLQYLSLDTEYTVSLTDVRDVYGCTFNEYSFSFTTRLPSDNLKPEVTLSSEKERYNYGDTITLTAVARDELATSDINGGEGAIVRVEFLADGEVIGSVQVTEPSVDDIYTFDWTNAEKRLEPYRITARAWDNNEESMTSEPISVQVFDSSYPEVSLTVPEKVNGKILGVSSGKILVNASATDIDGEITSVELRLFAPNGDQVGETMVFTENFESMAHAFTDGLDAKGTYRVELTATDNNSSYEGDDLSTVTEAYVYVSHMGKAYPAAFTDDLTDPANKGKWTLTGTAEKTVDENGLTITQTTSGEARASRTTFQLISSKVLVAEMAVKFSDNSHERVVSFDGVTENLEVSFSQGITFDSSGKIIFNSAEKGSYKENTEYRITVLLDLVSKQNIFFLNGEKLGELTPTETSTKLNLTMNISQTVSSETASFSILEYGLYNLGECIDSSAITVTLKDGGVAQTGTSFTGVSQYPEYIAISASGTIDEESIKKGVLLVGPDGKPCATTFADGKIYINEKLIAGAEYTLRLTPDIRVGNAGLAETLEYTVTTDAKENNSIDVLNTGFVETDLTSTTTSVNFDTEISGIGTVVCVVYVGNQKKEIICLENQTGTVNLPVDLSTIFGGASIPENAYIEAFVINNLTDMVPVSDIIYRLD